MQYMRNMDLRGLLTIKEVSLQLEISEAQVRNLVVLGKIHPKEDARQKMRDFFGYRKVPYLFTQKAVDHYRESRHQLPIKHRMVRAAVVQAQQRGERVSIGEIRDLTNWRRSYAYTMRRKLEAEIGLDQPGEATTKVNEP